MKDVSIKIEMNVVLTQEDIDDIMSSALDFIGYWCEEAEVVGEYLGEYASEQISRGGTLKLYDMEDEKVYNLTLNKFLKGFRLWVKNGSDEYHAVSGGKVDTCNIDGLMADMIIQYAIFGEVIYG